MNHGPPVTAGQQASRKIVAGHPAGMLRESGRQHLAAYFTQRRQQGEKIAELKTDMQMHLPLSSSSSL